MKARSSKALSRQLTHLECGSGDPDLDTAALNLLNSLKDIDDQSDGAPSRMQSPMVQSIVASPTPSPYSSFHGSPILSRNRRAGQTRTLQNSASTPVMSRNGNSAVCRGNRGERLRGVGQSMLQNSSLRRSRQASPFTSSTGELQRTPFGGRASGQGGAHFKGIIQETLEAFQNSEDYRQYKDQQRSKNRQNRNANEPASSEDVWQPHLPDALEQHVAQNTERMPPKQTPTTVEQWHARRHQRGASSSLTPLDDNVPLSAKSSAAAVEELKSLRLVHAQTLDEMGQVTQQLRRAHDELQSRSTQLEPDTRVKKQEEEINKLKSKLSQTRTERDQLKVDLKRCLDSDELTSEDSRPERGIRNTAAEHEYQRCKEAAARLQNELNLAREQLRAQRGFDDKEKSLQRLRKDFEEAKGELETKDVRLQKLQEELNKTKQQLEKMRKNNKLEDTPRTLEVQRQEVQVQKLQEELEQTKDEYNTMLEEQLKQTRRNSMLEEELVEAQEQLSRRENALKELQGNSSSFSVLPSIAEESVLQTQEENTVLKQAVCDYSCFVNQIINSSARPVLYEALDMSSLKLLGMGHYGYVMTCKSKPANDKVVLKLQGSRLVDLAVREWARSKEVGTHPNIVELKEIFLHSDSNQAIRDNIIASFKGESKVQEALSGNRSKWFPSSYVCLVSEHMDCGSVASLMDKELLTLEGVCAVTRQVAAALAHMHKGHRNHNEVKLSTILLKRACHKTHGDVLHVKLADPGSAEHTLNHSRDSELLAYAIWCMVVGRYLPDDCLDKESRPKLMAEFQKAPRLGRTATAQGTALIETVFGLWDAKLDMASVAGNVEFEGCEVRDAQVPEMKRQLAASANLTVTQHASDLLNKFQQPSHSAPLANALLGDVGASPKATSPKAIAQTKMADTNEAAIAVLASRSEPEEIEV